MLSKDTRRIAVPSNCTSPKQFISPKNIELSVDEKHPRHDGRNLKEFREMNLEVGLITSVSGSAYFEWGNTKVISSINGPKDIHKSESTTKGQICCEFKYALFSCDIKQSHLPTNEEQRISKSLQDALESVVLIHKYPKARIDVSILVLENGGGVLSAALTCAGIALSNAGVEMYALPIACSLIVYNGKIMMDPSKEEEENLSKQENSGSLILGMMPQYYSQVIFMEQFGNFTSILPQCLKQLHDACQCILNEISLMLKQHLQERENFKSTNLSLSIADNAQVATLKIFQPQKYINSFLSNNLRPDDRELTEFRSLLINNGAINTSDGSALIRLKNTFVLCGIKAELTNPTLEEPKQGFFIPNVTMTQICSNMYLSGPPPEQAQIYSQMLMDLWKDSHFISPESLCIAEKKLCWCIFAEIICLNHDGNVFDACLLALMSALNSTKLPEVSVKEENIEVKENKMSLKIENPIFSCTFASFEDYAIPDPTLEEEMLADGLLTIFFNKENNFRFNSFGSFKEDQIPHCIRLAKKRISELKIILRVS